VVDITKEVANTNPRFSILNSVFSVQQVLKKSQVKVSRGSSFCLRLQIQRPIVIKELQTDEGDREGAEKLLNQLVALALIINIFFLPSLYFHRADAKPLNLEREV
jgi:hypothetical protein